MINPGSWLGVMGGGQLGRMFVMAAHELGYRVVVLDPDPASIAAAAADRHICAALDDVAALGELASCCQAVTVETENVPVHALDTLAKSIRVAPSPRCVAIAQDRIKEKQFIAGIGLQPVPHQAVLTTQDLDGHDSDLLPGILKLSRMGYDGKGQVAVDTITQVRDAFVSFGSKPCVLEKKIALQTELSVLVSRDQYGTVAVWPVAQNHHQHGILDWSRIPAQVPDQITAQAINAATRIAHELDYCGVLCVEFFLSQDQQLLINELAPRPHNSGHWTMDACKTSQFEQQVRILAGLPLGDTKSFTPAIMKNLMGDIWQSRQPNWHKLLQHPGVCLHLYGKDQPRVARKMGHFTCIKTTEMEVETLFQSL